VEAPVSTHDPFTHGSAVTILPGVPLEGVPAQRTEAQPAPEAQAPATPAALEAPIAPVAAPVAPPVAPPSTAFPPPATIAPVPPTAIPVPPPASAIPPAGPAYIPQAQAFAVAPVFDDSIPAAPAAFPIDVPVAAAPTQASPFSAAPAPAFPPADAVTVFPAQIPTSPFQSASTQPVPLPQIDIAPDEKQGRIGRRRKEGSSTVSSVKVVAATAVVLGLAAGWFGHGALSGSGSNSGSPAPVASHAGTSHVVPLKSVAAIGSVHALPKPWVTTGQQAFLSSSVVSATTPAYFGSGGSHGTFAEMGVSVGTLSRVAASRGVTFPAGAGGGIVRCGVNAIGGQATSWCTWKDARSSGMVTRFVAPTVTDAYRWTQLVRQTLEP
jgi:hypothetical protein